MALIAWIKKNHGCSLSIEWVKAQPDRSVEALWRTCENGSWMIWAYERSDSLDTIKHLDPVRFFLANRVIRNAQKGVKQAGRPEWPEPFVEIKDEDTLNQAMQTLFRQYHFEFNNRPMERIDFTPQNLKLSYDLLCHLQSNRMDLSRLTYEIFIIQAGWEEVLAGYCREVLPVPIIKLD
jgi:hypothetical protein